MKDSAAAEVFWDTFIHPIFRNRPIYVAATPAGICRITWPAESFDALSGWLDKHLPDAVVSREPGPLSECFMQLHQYFEGERKQFDLPLDMRGSVFQTSVWRALTNIPYGQIRSYSDIAESVGKPAAVRAVGTANGANPVPIVVPCHRVIGKNAALTGFRGGLQIKEALLQLEGCNDYTQKGHARFQF